MTDGHGSIVPLALYIHIPWCRRKCPYCDFNSYPAPGPLPERAYADALLADLEQDLPRTGGRSVSSVFFGGGTPGLLAAATVDRLLAGVRDRLQLEPDAEVTLEVNPGAADRQKLHEFRAAGVNRLSIGAQSFNEEHLRRIGRIHGRREAIAAVAAAQAAGFDNVNLDLLFGLPGQSPSQALADVAEAIALNPAHISRYQLTLEPDTAFYRHPPPLPDEESLADMEEAGRRLLAEHGYRQYEISAYALEQRCCRHNLNYWRFGDYLGIGAGAHGKLTDQNGRGIYRYWKRNDPDEFLRHVGTPRRVGGERALSGPDRVLEFMMNALRLTEGVPLTLFEARTGLPLARLEPALSQAVARGLVRPDDAWLGATELGQRFLNDLLALFVPEPGGSD